MFGRCIVQAAAALWHMRKSPHNSPHLMSLPTVEQLLRVMPTLAVQVLTYTIVDSLHRMASSLCEVGLTNTTTIAIEVALTVDFAPKCTPSCQKRCNMLIQSQHAGILWCSPEIQESGAKFLTWANALAGDFNRWGSQSGSEHSTSKGTELFTGNPRVFDAAHVCSLMAKHLLRSKSTLVT